MGFLLADLVTRPSARPSLGLLFGCSTSQPQPPWQAVMMSLAEEFGANVAVTTGGDLLKEGDDYPQVCRVKYSATDEFSYQ